MVFTVSVSQSESLSVLQSCSLVVLQSYSSTVLLSYCLIVVKCCSLYSLRLVALKSSSRRRIFQSEKSKPFCFRRQQKMTHGELTESGFRNVSCQREPCLLCKLLFQSSRFFFFAFHFSPPSVLGLLDFSLVPPPPLLLSSSASAALCSTCRPLLLYIK